MIQSEQQDPIACDSNQNSAKSGFTGRFAAATALALSLLSFEASGTQPSGQQEKARDSSAQITPDLSEFAFDGSAGVRPTAAPITDSGCSAGEASLESNAAAQQRELAVSEGVGRIAVTPEARDWMKRQVDIAAASLRGEGEPRLIDGTTFLTEATERVLKRYVGIRDDEMGMTFQKIDEEGYKFAFVRDDGETWYVAECPYYRDQFPRGIAFSGAHLELYKKGSDKLIQKEFSAQAVFPTGRGVARIKFEEIEQVMRAAEEARTSEIADAVGIRTLKLPQAPIGYIGLVDQNASDPIMSSLVDDMKYFPQVMNLLVNEEGERICNLVSQNGSEYIAVNGWPQSILRDQIGAMHAKGIRKFYLNFGGHGNEHGIYFSSDAGYQVLTPYQLHEVFSDYQDSDFIVDTVACYGGGMAEKMKSYRDPSGREDRVTMKLQAKPYSYNQEGRLVGETDARGIAMPYSSYYQIFNTYFLVRGETFGSAHYLADIAAKRLIPCDAEVWRSSPEGGRSTLRD